MHFPTFCRARENGYCTMKWFREPWTSATFFSRPKKAILIHNLQRFTFLFCSPVHSWHSSPETRLLKRNFATVYNFAINKISFISTLVGLTSTLVGFCDIDPCFLVGCDWCPEGIFSTLPKKDLSVSAKLSLILVKFVCKPQPLSILGPAGS